MSDQIAKGTWVEIQRTVLAPGKRARQVPDDTQATALELRVKGFLVESAELGKEVEIETTAGRLLRGTLVEANPSYTHGFGRPIPSLSTVGGEVRDILRCRREHK